jgi:hypothetical protein
LYQNKNDPNIDPHGLDVCITLSCSCDFCKPANECTYESSYLFHNESYILWVQRFAPGYESLYPGANPTTAENDCSKVHMYVPSYVLNVKKESYVMQVPTKILTEV